LSMLFCAASVLYLLPWYHGPYEQFTIAGTEQSLYGILGFAFGSLALSPVFLDSGLLPRATGGHQFDSRLPSAYLVIGGISYVLLAVLFGQVPSLNAILSSGQELVVVGLSLSCWQAWRDGNTKKAAFWLMVGLLPPFITIVTRGFIGYG